MACRSCAFQWKRRQRTLLWPMIHDKTVGLCACSYIAEMSPDEEDAPLPRGSPIGCDSTGALYFRLGGDGGALIPAL